MYAVDLSTGDSLAQVLVTSKSNELSLQLPNE